MGHKEYSPPPSKDRWLAAAVLNPNRSQTVGRPSGMLGFVEHPELLPEIPSEGLRISPYRTQLVIRKRDPTPALPKPRG